MSKEPKAKKHSFFSNMFFIFKTITKWDKTVVPISLLMSPFLILTDLIVAYFVTTLTWCIENQKGIGSIVLAALGLAAFSVVTGVIPNRLNEKTSIKKAEINRRFDLLLGEKIMDMDFEKRILGAGVIDVDAPMEDFDKKELKTRIPPKKAVELARGRIGERGYNILYNNILQTPHNSNFTKPT